MNIVRYFVKWNIVDIVGHSKMYRCHKHCCYGSAFRVMVYVLAVFTFENSRRASWKSLSPGHSTKGRAADRTVVIIVVSRCYQSLVKCLHTSFCLVSVTVCAPIAESSKVASLHTDQLLIASSLHLQLLLQTRREYCRPLWIAYVDLKAAFDSVNREAL